MRYKVLYILKERDNLETALNQWVERDWQLHSFVLDPKVRVYTVVLFSPEPALKD